MSYILDTCVISELISKQPDKNVLDWFSDCEEDDLYISSLTLGELKYGIDILPDGKKKNDLMVWFGKILDAYKDSTLHVNDKIALRWGEERARLKKSGIQISVIDSLIACTAIEFNFTLVTRNTPDFKPTGVTLLNPWL